MGLRYNILPIIILVLTIVISSCSLDGRKVSDTDSLSTRSHPEELWIKWNIKKYDHNGYKPWPYKKEIRCGWFYDEWLNQIDSKSEEVCNWQCLELDRFEVRDWFYPTLERCLYQDYKGGVDTTKGVKQ